MRLKFYRISFHSFQENEKVGGDSIVSLASVFCGMDHGLMK